MTEAKIQKKISDRLEADGWFVIKMIRTNRNGIPDLLALKSGEDPWFIEVKKPGVGVVSKLQEFRIKQMRNHGFRAEILEK